MVLTSKKIIDDCCIFALKITSCFLDRLENAYFLSCYRIKFMFWIYFESKIKNILSCFFLSLPRRFFWFSSIFHLQKEIMFVFWPFLAPNIASHPEHESFVSWICWFDSWKFHFYKNWKTQIILFEYKTHHKNSCPICFMTGDMYIVNAFICYFWFVAFLLQLVKNWKT